MGASLSSCGDGRAAGSLLCVGPGALLLLCAGGAGVLLACGSGCVGANARCGAVSSVGQPAASA